MYGWMVFWWRGGGGCNFADKFSFAEVVGEPNAENVNVKRKRSY